MKFWNIIIIMMVLEGYSDSSFSQNLSSKWTTCPFPADLYMAYLALLSYNTFDQGSNRLPINRLKPMNFHRSFHRSKFETCSKYTTDEFRPNLTWLRKFTNRNGIESEKSYDFFHCRKIKQIIVSAIISELRKRGKGCT